MWQSGLGANVVGRRAACLASAARHVPAPIGHPRLAVTFDGSTAFVPGRAGARRDGVRPPRELGGLTQLAHRLPEGRPDEPLSEQPLVNGIEIDLT